MFFTIDFFKYNGELKMNYIKPIHQTLIEEVIHKAENDNRVVGVVLYGSAVKNSNYHDIDVCLIPNNNTNFSELFKDYLYSTKEIIDIRIFDELPLYIQVRVMKEGILILQKDYDKIFQKYLQTINNWRYFEPHLHTYLEAVKYG